MFKIRWVTAAVTMILSLVLLFGGWSLYRNFGLIHPLETQLSADPAVENVMFDFSGKNRRVVISLKRVEDLRSTYHTLSNKVYAVLGSDSIVQIEGHPSKELTTLYEGFEPAIYEGIAKKNYTEMIASLQKLAKDNGVGVCKVTMDQNNIYIQLEKGSDSLYQVITYISSTNDRIGVSLPVTSSEVTSS